MTRLSPVVFQFLEQLRENNYREWYHRNKGFYKQAKTSVEEFLDALISELAILDPELKDLTAKHTMFRIYRDVRFRKDKTPYKTFFDAVIAPGGRKSLRPGFYIHITPGSSMVGGGLYCLEKQILDAVRKEMYYNGEKLRKILRDNDFTRWYGSVNTLGHELKQLPKGYPKDSPNQDLLKMKTMVSLHEVSDELLMSDKAIPYLVETYKVLQPFNDFFSEAIEMGWEEDDSLP